MSTATLLLLAEQMRDHRARPCARHAASLRSGVPRTTLAGLAAFMLASLAGDAALARSPQDAETGRIGGKPAPCVVVDVAGERVGHLDCASQKLEQAARIAQAQTRGAIDTPVPRATSADVVTGVANQAATRQRMGNAFGVSVHPQRPNRVPPMPRPGGRP